MKEADPHAEWIDVTVPLHHGMVHWPGDPPVQIERVRAVERGHHSNLTHLSMSAHTGTHLDAPLHYVDGAAAVDSMPLAATVGPARVIGVAAPTAIEVADLAPHDVRAGDRLLLRTRNSDRRWVREPFREDYVHLSSDCARWLVERRVRTVGVDYLSVSAYGADGQTTHRALLGAGIWVIEGLDLWHVAPGRYELMCLPIKIAGGDGAPVRAFLRARD